ncbi:MAG: thioredoxin domain-containing protein [Anaerolineaceae bacterium]|nr:thioredoxin domain-containing protein [Anaerolineaceae bacterium]
MNRLVHETSPYLLQHRDNPVHWYPWGEEAFARARDEDKPLLLSVGYSACHWCHVMAHESFEHEATAALMNELFVNVKVDREERPDVDDIYMQAVQALSGHGGWPMTVFLLPDGRPFYGGTYYPREARMGMPAFRDLLRGVEDAYRNRRDEVDKAAGSLTGALGRLALNIGGPAEKLNEELLDAAAAGVLRNLDARHGGFGGAPKFPQPMILEFLLRAHLRTGDRRPLQAATLTLTKMARGGMYDQIGGGFHRYSVDAVWLVPHFEKMLYDNAQLARCYLHAWQVTGDTLYRDIATETCDYILREMTHPGGGFFSATDADSEGEEGRFFVWDMAELQEVLGEEAALACEYWGVSAGGNFEGSNILNVATDPAELAASYGISEAQLAGRIEAMRAKLYAAREERVHPGLDDKVLSAWNGMMLASLAEAARVLQRPDWRDAAIRNAEFLLAHLRRDDGRLLRTHKDGASHVNGFLEDYANLCDGLLELYQTTWDERWFRAARELADQALKHFAADGGGFFDTSDDHETLIVRPRNLQDNATPSGSAMLARQLLRLAAWTGESQYQEAAVAALRLLVEALRAYPQAFGEALNAVDMLVSGLQEVAFVGAPDEEGCAALVGELRSQWRPNTVAALSGQMESGESAIPLLRGRVMIDGRATVYVCRHFACQLPVTDVEALRQELQGDTAATAES